MKVERKRQAIQDIADIANTIYKRQPKSALKFLNVIEQTIDQIRIVPLQGSLLDTDNEPLKFQHVRIVLLKGFRKYGLFYSIQLETITILAVLHLARDWEWLMEKRVTD